MVVCTLSIKALIHVGVHVDKSMVFESFEDFACYCQYHSYSESLLTLIIPASIHVDRVGNLCPDFKHLNEPYLLPIITGVPSIRCSPWYSYSGYQLYPVAAGSQNFSTQHLCHILHMSIPPCSHSVTSMDS